MFETSSSSPALLARGFERVHSIALAENPSAIALQEEMGFTARPCAEDMSLTGLTKLLPNG